jgi:hypothetical protein
MGLFDTLLGRSKPVRPNLDNLFALPSAAVTLQVSAGLSSTRKAGVCFKPPAGEPFAQTQSEIEEMLDTPDSAPAAAGSPQSTPVSPAVASLTVRHVSDSFGYRWILVEGGEIEDLVTRVHMVHSSLEDAGWSTQLLCSVFGFAPTASQDGPGSGSSGDGAAALATTADADASEALGDNTDALCVNEPVYLVYLAKRGTFYPFAPTGKEKRDTELELRLRSILGNDLPVEADLSNWFPIWDLPIS